MYLCGKVKICRDMNEKPLSLLPNRVDKNQNVAMI